VARVAPAVERSLVPGVIANRAVGPDVRLEDWRIAHRRWRGVTTPPGRGLRLHLDVADCYASILPEIAAAALHRLGAASPSELIRFLHELRAHGVPGLPIGPDPSAVLANAVLAGIDRTVASAGAPHVRWVDDLVVEVRSRRHAIRVLDGVRRELAGLGLSLQAAKTRLEDARDAAPCAASFAAGAVR
jgi:reverse transcriptase-like protein